MTDREYTEFLTTSRESIDYWVEVAQQEFTEDLVALMEEDKISRKELARRLGSSPAYITKVLRGNANFTLVTMTKLARAVGTTLHVHLAPEAAVVRWTDERTGTLAVRTTYAQESQSLLRYGIATYSAKRETPTEFADLGALV